VPVLAVLLVLLLAGCAVLWATRPGDSAVRTDAYVGALQAARAGIVDVASFDYVTIDDDIAQIRTVTTGDLQQESVDQLDQRRQQITDAQAVVDTTVVGAAVGDADQDSATVFAVIQSTQQTNASAQAQVQRYRVEISLQRVDGRWLLSGITGR
jgi:Mce-associated membrane protein